METNLEKTAVKRRGPGRRFESRDIDERFADHYSIEPDGCWLWTATRDLDSGFPRFWFDGRCGQAHRFAYERYVAPIPDGKVVRRTCGNSGCVNPEHLELADHGGYERIRRDRPYKNVYNDPRWKRAREAALLRDGNRCTVARFFGESCKGMLHVHHIVPLGDGGHPFDLENLGTVCARHHVQWEALRSEVVRSLSDDLAHRIRCPHTHRSREAREQCERRMARRRGLVAA